MNSHILLLLLSITSLSFSQIKKQDHKEFRSKKEVELETVIQKINDALKHNYHFSKTDFYTIDSELTVNEKPFYVFQGISTLQTISPIACERKFSLDTQKFEANKASEDKIFKGERNPREQIPFYLTSVFEQLENFFESYHFFSKADFSFSLIENNAPDFYTLSFRSKNEKLPIVGKIMVSKTNYLPKSFEYTISTDYSFVMSADNFNYTKSKGYTAKVLKEFVAIEFQNNGNEFSIVNYQSHFKFQNEDNASPEKRIGDIGNSKITIEYYGKTPKICPPLFDLNTLTYKME